MTELYCHTMGFGDPKIHTCKYTGGPFNNPKRCLFWVLFFSLFCHFSPPSFSPLRHVTKDGDGGGGLLLPPEPQRAGDAAGEAGNGAGEAKGGVGAAAAPAGQARAGAAAAEAAGARPGGLH